MDMLNILKNLDAAEKGEVKVEKSANNNDMKMILESFNAVEEGCGDMPPSAPPAPPQPEKVRMNVNINAEGTDAIADLLKLMSAADSSPVAPIPGGASFDLDKDGADDMELMVPMSEPVDDHDDMKRMMQLMAPKEKDGKLDLDVDNDHQPDLDTEGVEEDWDNSPDETYDDHEKMINDLSGGLNRKKKQYAKAQDGDNAMAVEQTIKEQLLQALSEKKKKDPCWKDYEMIGMKKKNGKEVPNCVPKKD